MKAGKDFKKAPCPVDVSGAMENHEEVFFIRDKKTKEGQSNNNNQALGC